MSAFSNVDAADDPRRLLASLQQSAQGLASMKHYMAVAHASRGSGPVLDVGCGSGHELAVLDRFGVSAVGADPSEVMLTSAREQTAAPLVRSAGEVLPFRSGAFAGCWIERVLQHVADPSVLLAEAVRCVAPGGLVTVFEPDWTSLVVNGRQMPAELTNVARHPAIGSEVGELLDSLGCFVRDRVEERSWWTFETLARSMGRIAALDEVRASAEAGTFSAEIVKVLWVATTDTVRP